MKKFNFLFDLIVMIIFISLIYKNYIEINKTFGIFIIGLIILVLFIFYKGLSYILNLMQFLLSRVEKKEKIKKFFLNPIVNKVVYYMMGSLPGNIGYGIYFGVMENGGYIRVGISSNRDIFFGKYFKGDSRDFFFNLNNKINEIFYLNGIKKNIIDNIYKIVFRLLIIIYVIRKKILEINVKEYIGVRIIIYMYLSIFYLYFVFYFHVFNYYLFFLLIFVEILLLIFFTQIVEKIEKIYGIDEKFYYALKNKGIITEEFIDIRNKLLFPLFIDYRLKGEINVFIGDKTLSNSITLNMLYKYMIGVNKNTEGYYDRQMNIRSRIHRKKYIEEKSIIGDILPRTRYVITSLKYLGYEYYYFNYRGMDVGKEYEFINLSKNKNLFLSYYEKTYIDTSFLMLLWFLRINKSFGSSGENNNCTFESEQLKNLFYYKADADRSFNVLFYIYYCEKDKRFFNENILFSFFFNKGKYFYFDVDYTYYYKLHLLANKKNIEISNKFVNLKNYKLMFKIMGRIQLYEEETVVWNENLYKLLVLKEKFLIDGLEEIKKSKLSEEEKLSYKYFIFLKKNESEFDLCSRNEALKNFFLIVLSNYMTTKPELMILSEKVINNEKMGIDFSKILITNSFGTNKPNEDKLKILYIETLIEFGGYDKTFQSRILIEFKIDKYLSKFNFKLIDK